MKKKLVVTIGEEKIKEVERLIESGRFRSKSHLAGHRIDNFLKGEKE